MKLITLDNLKTFLDKLLEQITADIYTKQEVDEKLKEIGSGSVGDLRLNKSKNSLLELNQYVATDNADDVVNKIIQLCIKQKDVRKLSSKPIKKGATSFTLVGEPHFYVDYKGKTYEIPDSGELTITTNEPLNEKFYVNYRRFDKRLYSNDVLINVGDEYVLITLKSKLVIIDSSGKAQPPSLKERGKIGTPLIADNPKQGIWCKKDNYPGYNIMHSQPSQDTDYNYDYQYFYAEKGAPKPRDGVILRFYRDGCTIHDIRTSGFFFTKDETWEIKYDEYSEVPLTPPDIAP